MADSISNTETKGALDVLAAEALTSKTGTTAKPIISNKDVLENTQKLYDQKLAEKNYFLQDMADAAAWWSGGAAGPSVGLALRAQTRAAQAKQLEDLQAQIMSGRVNLAQLGEANASMGAPSANVDGLTGGAPAGGQAMSPAIPGAGYNIRGVPVPEVVYKAYQAYLKQGNLAKATEVFDTYNKESTKGEIGFATNPSTYKQDDYFDKSSGKMDRRTPMELRGGVTQPSAQIPTPTAAPNAPVTAPVVTGAQDAVQAGIPVISGYRDEEKQAKLYAASQQPGYKGNPVAKPGQSLHQTGEAIDVADFKKLKPEQLKWLRENGYQQTMPDTDPNHFAKIGTPRTVGAPSVMTTSAAVEPTGATTTKKPQSYSDYLIEQAGRKEYSEKSAAASGEATGKRQAAFENAAVEAGRDLQSTNSMLNIIDNNPGAVGYSFKNPKVGATIEGVKLLTGKDIEPFARRLTLSKEDIEAGNKFDTLAQKNSLKFRQDVFKGTGAVSDFETKLAERASGLSRDNSIETNRFFAILAAESYRTVNKLGVEWDKYKKANPSADFAQFEQSEPWKKATAERSARLEKLLPDLARSELAFGEKAPAKGADKTELEGWKQRYGTPRE